MDYNDIPEAARKYHYWRGFIAASIIYIPILVIYLYLATKVFDALN